MWIRRKIEEKVYWGALILWGDKIVENKDEKQKEARLTS